VEKAKKKGSYSCGDVLERLKADFYNKCYICEAYAPTTINIEHFIPHKGNKDLKFDWNNLFYACGHCNNTKLAKYDDILNCLDNNQKILELIKFHINPFPKEKVQITVLQQGKTIENTTKLLEEIYNGTTTQKIIEGENLRELLLQEIRDFNDLLFEYFENDISPRQKIRITQKIAQKLSPASAFTAFKICIVKSNSTLLEAFEKLLPM
jgi:hypothetical protein